MKGVFECRPCKTTFKTRAEKDAHRADPVCPLFVRKRRLNGRKTYWCTGTTEACKTPFGSKKMRDTHVEVVHTGWASTKGKKRPATPPQSKLA